MVALAVGRRHDSRRQRALGDQGPDLLRRLLVEHGVQRVHEQEILFVAARRPDGQPAHAAFELDVVGEPEAQLLGVELLGRVLVEDPHRHDGDTCDHGPTVCPAGTAALIRK